MITFNCVRNFEDTDQEGNNIAKTDRWEGTAEVNLPKPGIIDAVIEGRQIRVTVIIGILKSSSFIAIPDLYLSIPLSEWKELFWNAEPLSTHINNIDAITVSAGVRALMEMLRNAETCGM